MNRNVKPVLAALSLSVLLAACSKAPDAQGGPGGGGMPPPLSVSVVTVQPQAVPVVFEYTGQTAGSKEVEVRARVGGILERRTYTEGAWVERGAVLFELDPKPLQAQAAAAEADVATAEARLAQAAREAARIKPLLADEAVRQQEYDNAVSNEQIAAAGLKAARARLQQIQLDLGYTKVVAPVGGYSGRALKSEGSLVSSADSLLTTLVQLNPLHVAFGPSENEQNAIEREAVAGSLVLPKGNAYTVELRNTDGSVLAKGGRLAFSDSRVNTSTGTVEMRAEVPNSGGQVRAGQFVRVALFGATRPDAIVLPQGAVLEGPQGKMVFAVVPGKDGAPPSYAQRPVEVGEWAQLGNMRGWVIRKGLAAGDKVIVDNLPKLTMMPPGMPIQIADASVPAAAPVAQPAAPAAK